MQPWAALLMIVSFLKGIAAVIIFVAKVEKNVVILRIPFNIKNFKNHRLTGAFEVQLYVAATGVPRWSSHMYNPAWLRL